MGDIAYLVRFFRAVPPVPPMLAATFGAVTLVTAAAVAIAPARTPQALMPLLMLQLFAGASGFAGPARRGYYDLLLTRSGRRWHIAVVHWLSSIAPGVACWSALAVVEAVASRGAQSVATASGTVVAIFLLSTLPWAATVALPRFAGAIGWLVWVVTIASVAPSVFGTQMWPVDADARPLGTALVVLLYPPSLVGRAIELSDVVCVWPACAVAVAATSAAVAWIARADIPLEAAQ